MIKQLMKARQALASVLLKRVVGIILLVGGFALLALMMASVAYPGASGSERLTALGVLLISIIPIMLGYVLFFHRIDKTTLY